MTKRILVSLFLYSCGGIETEPALDPEGTSSSVEVLPAVHCPCDQQGTTSFLPGQDGGPTLVICAPACTPVGKTPLGPNVGTCQGINECLNCCHWLTPKELGY